MKQFGVLLLLAANFFAVEGAFAETGHATAPSDSAHPAIEPAALDILKAASEKLASAKRISFVAHGAFDVPARNGQPLFYHTRSEVLLVRPNKLRVIVPGDGPPSEFYFDGAKVAVFTPRADLIASADAPGSVEQMLAAIYEKAGIYFPLWTSLLPIPTKRCRFGSAQRTSCPGSFGPLPPTRRKSRAMWLSSPIGSLMAKHPRIQRSCRIRPHRPGRFPSPSRPLPPPRSSNASHHPILISI
jgi:Predicted periplasmic protein (DUF2092)